MTLKQFAITLYLLGVIQFGEFQLKAHRIPGWPKMKLSPFFINLREHEYDGPLSYNGARFVGQQLGLWFAIAFPDVFKECKHILGIPRAGTTLAKGFHEAVAGNGVTLLKMEKEGGKGSKIAPTVVGEFAQGDTVLVIDDVITDGASKIEIAEILMRLGLKPIFLVVVDRGGATDFAEKGYLIYPMYALGTLMHHYREAGIITADDLEEILGYDAYMRQYKADHPAETEVPAEKRERALEL